MRRKETQKISDILKQFQKESAYEKKLLESRVITNWSKVLGPGIGNATQNLYMANRVLFVHIDSPVMRQELFMIRTQIQVALNKSVGAEVVDNIIFR